MIRNFQTIIDSVHGNCMQAAISSLFELPLDAVPNFVELDEPFEVLGEFARARGYDCLGARYNSWLNNYLNGLPEYKTIDQLYKYRGIKGYFLATTYSPKYYKYCLEQDNIEQITHAVLCDKNYNIVHDPNPNNINMVYPRADVLGYNGIIDVFLICEK